MARTSIATDSFTEAVGTPNLEAHGAPDWACQLSANAGGFIVVDSSPDLVKGAFSVSLTPFRWIGSGSFTPAGQYAKATVAGLTFSNSNNQAGVGVWCSGTDGTAQGYFVTVSDDAASGGSHTVTLWRLAAGSFTSLASFSNTYSNGDTIELEVSGSGTSTLLSMFRNGSPMSTATFTDSGGSALSSTSTKPGLAMRYAAPTSLTLDNWEGGDVGAGAATLASRKLLLGVGA